MLSQQLPQLRTVAAIRRVGGDSPYVNVISRKHHGRFRGDALLQLTGMRPVVARMPFFGRDAKGMPREVGLLVPPEILFPGAEASERAYLGPQ